MKIVFTIALLLMFALGSCDNNGGEEEKPHKVVKKQVLDSPLAGRWYPAEEDALRAEVEQLFRAVDSKPLDNVIALILPHAGYKFSGKTAAFGLKTLSKRYSRIVIIGPSHYVALEGRLSLAEITHYRTPLGEIPLDLAFVEKLNKYPMFIYDMPAQREEHSVQIQLPLLQYIQPTVRVVPIVAGHCSPEEIEQAANILRSLIDEETLVIASSDFVHYGPRYDYVPFTQDIPQKLRDLHAQAFEFISRRDSRGFLDYCSRTGATICGYIPIAILLAMLPESAQATLVAEDNSASVLGDYTNSVSYLSIAFTGRWSQVKTELTDKDKELLATLARKSLEYYLKEDKVPELSDLGISIGDREALKQPRATFVTLKKKSQLRGCIGEIFPHRPLYESVIQNTISSAVHDPRFPPVKLGEAKDLTISISVLTVPTPVDSAQEIRLGTDGIVLKKNEKSAVFLPQVAPEQGWNLEQTLSHLSMKAGLAKDAWKEGVEFLVFQAIVFGEEKKR